MQFNPDAIHYADVAQTILEDHVIGTWHLTADSQRAPDTLLYWPPLYPIALALFMGMGLSVMSAAWAVSVVGYTASAWLLTYWHRQPGLAIGGVLAFLYLAFTAGAPFRAWSENTFIPLTLASLLCMASAMASSSARKAAWMGFIAGLLGGGAMLTRYVGLAVAPALAGAALFTPHDENEREANVRRNSLLAATVGMAITVLPWLIRNVYLNGVLFGPSRPPNTRSLTFLMRFPGESIYQDLGPLLLAFIFVIAGYHRVPRIRSESALASGWTKTGALIWGGIICAFGQFGLVMLTHIVFQVDEPPTKRYYLPAYTCLLLAGLAWATRAEFPKHSLRQHWGLLLVVALPLILAPVFAESVSTEVTPRYTALDRWVEANTGTNDLLVADRAWPLRFRSGRPVLEAGQVAAPNIADGQKVARFLQRLGEHFDEVYLLPSGDAEEREALASYRAAGLQVEEVAHLITQPQHFKHYEEYEQKVYRITGWR